MAVANPAFYAGAMATKNGCHCGGKYFLESQTVGFCIDEQSIVETLGYRCGVCHQLKHVAIPMRGEQYKKMADNARKKLAR